MCPNRMVGCLRRATLLFLWFMLQKGKQPLSADFFSPQLSISSIYLVIFFHLLLHNIGTQCEGGVFIHLKVSESANVFSLGGLTLSSSPLLSSSALYPSVLHPPSCCFHLICSASPFAVLLLLLLPQSVLWGRSHNGLCLAALPDVRPGRVCTTARAEHLLKAALTVL